MATAKMLGIVFFKLTGKIYLKNYLLFYKIFIIEDSIKKKIPPMYIFFYEIGHAPGFFFVYNYNKFFLVWPYIILSKYVNIFIFIYT